jgi:hypothetical protein
MREVPFVRKADNLTLATSHLAQSSSASHPRQRHDDPRLAFCFYPQVPPLEQPLAPRPRQAPKGVRALLLKRFRNGFHDGRGARPREYALLQLPAGMQKLALLWQIY